MKKFTSDKIVRAMELTLFALLLAEAYLMHKDEIEQSVARLKTIIEKGDKTDGEQTTEN